MKKLRRTPMDRRVKSTMLAGGALLFVLLVASSFALVSAAPGPDLQIDKRATGLPYLTGVATAGEELIYEIEVYNSGDAATNVVVSDTLPSDVTYLGSSPDVCNWTGANPLTCYLGDMGPYEHQEFQVKVLVAPWEVYEEWDGTTTMDNYAVVGSDAADDDPSDNSVNHSIFVEDSADLTVTKMSKPDTYVEAGELFTYTIYVENLGPSIARFVAVRDNILSSGDFELVDLYTNRDEMGDMVSCEVQSIEPGITNTIGCMAWWLEPKSLMPPEAPPELFFDTGQWIINVVLRANESQDVNNLVEVFTTNDPDIGWLGTPDPDLSNNSAEDFIYVTDVANLSIDKYLDECWLEGDGSESECVAGGYAEFIIEVWNDGPSTAENVVVEDLIPAGVTVEEASVIEGGGSCTTGIPGEPLATLACNLGSLVDGDGRVISIIVRIDPDYVDAELPWDYRVLENDAWVYSDTFDPDNTYNRDYAMVDVYTLSELAVTKWGFPDVAGVGDGVEYEIRIFNAGPSTADMVQFADLLPPTVDYDDYYIEQGTGNCVYHDPLTHPFWEEYRGVQCYVDEIPPGGTVMVHLFGTYNENLWWAESDEEVCNIIPDDDPLSDFLDYWGADDPWEAPGWWADSYIAIPWENSVVGDEPQYLGWCPNDLYIEADLSIEKTSEPMTLYPGDEKTYHIAVTNNGPTGAPGVMVTDTLPISVTYEIDNGDCELVGSEPDVLQCYLGNMMPGETKGFDVWALVSPDAPPGEITNEAQVSMEAGDDPNGENNWAHATNLVLEPIFADLGLEKSWGQAPLEWFDGAPFAPEDCYPTEGVIRAGCPMTYSLTIGNAGPLVAENVVVEDVIPAGVTVEGVDSSQGSCTTGIPGDPSAPLTCNLGNIPRDEGAGVTVFVMTDADLAWEPLENDAEVSSDVPDPDTGNNLSHVLIWVEPFSYLYLDKEAPPEIMAGEEIEYWINLWNEGPSTAHEVYVDDELPGGVSLLSAEVMVGGGSCAPDSALCSLGDMEPGDNRGIRVRGYVEPGLEPETTITNTARAWANSPFYQPVPEQPISDTVETLIHSAADLSIRKTADPYKVYAGEQVRYDIEVTNHGPGMASNVVVSDTLDPGVEFEVSTADCEIIYGEWITPTMFGSTQPGEGDGELFTVDLDTGAGNYVGPMPDYVAADIEYDNTSGRLFASYGFQPWFWDWYDGYPWVEQPRLYELDPETGGPMGYVTLDEWCALPGLEFVGDTLYGACSDGPPWFWGGDPDLVTVNPDTGHVDYVGDTDLWDDGLIHGLAYDESSATMYGLVVPDEGPNALVTIDLGSGEADWLCDIYDDDYAESVYGLRAIEFGADGTLYGGIANDSDLVIIDPTPVEFDGEYCAMTHVGDTGFSVTGLALAELGRPLGVACHVGDIPPGETATFSIWARVKPDTLGMINNRVDVFTDTDDPNPDNNWDTEANLVLGKADLKVTKYGKPDGEVRAGEELEYWVLVDNLGPGYAHDVVLYDQISSDGYFDIWWGDEEDGDGEEYSCYVAGDCECDYGYCECWRDARLTCRLNDPLPVMSPGSSGRWLLKVWVEAYEDQSINNLARVVGSDFDPDLSNNEAIAEHEITAVADLELNKYAWGEVLVGCDGDTDWWEDEVAAGGTLRYILEIDNNGPSDAENVVVEEWGLSPFLDIIDVECEKDDYGECSCNTSELGELGDENRRLVCYLGTIENYDEDEITITARIPSDVPEGTRLVNDAKVYSDVLDDYNGDNLATNWTYVSRWADLEVEKTQDPEISLPGWDITYTVTVTNLGLSDAEGVFISDTIPVQVLNPTWNCCASDDGECDIPCEPPTCPVEPCPWPDIGLYAQADIPAGEWVIYTVEGTLDWWPCGPFTNTVEVIAPQSLVHPETDIDPCDENNTDIAVNDPLCHFDPLVLKTFPGPDSTD
jgi:uncharacterized repeat protein (TIGR01451 family)